ncbi:MAG: hypothetical protein IJR96_06535 [Pseudobutyrivibrio sp.]|nr:hypothetical protein [Pseudobutyrivibrio sp.]
MKRFILLTVTAAMLLSGCGNKVAQEETSEPLQSEVYEVTDSGADQEEPEETENTETVESQTAPSVDLDLTALSSTFIYAEVSNMMMEPLEYVGKKVKMEGTCATYQDPDTGKMYYACIIQDATQCCSQGLEFVLDEDTYTEEDYPAQGEEIIVEGTFATYEEEGGQYLTMLDSVLVEE